MFLTYTLPYVNRQLNKFVFFYIKEVKGWLDLLLREYFLQL